MGGRYYVDWEDDSICEEYQILKGPGGFECMLTEPEDRTFGRDLSPVISELNKADAEIAKLREEVAALNADFDTVASAGDQLAARLTTAERELAEARELLKRCVKMLRAWNGWGMDSADTLADEADAFLAKEQPND